MDWKLMSEQTSSRSSLARARTSPPTTRASCRRRPLARHVEMTTESGSTVREMANAVDEHNRREVVMEQWRSIPFYSLMALEAFRVLDYGRLTVHYFRIRVVSALHGEEIGSILRQ